MIYFTSDIHFGHKNIITMQRPQFADVYEMDTKLIDRWNSVVGAEDEVYFLGDLSFCGVARTADCVAALRGRKHWVVGNHDRKMAKKEVINKHFESIRELRRIKVHDTKINPITGGEYQHHQEIILCHFPLLVWEGAQRDTWHLHGHSHGHLHDTGEKRLDVGVDAVAKYGWTPYTPVSYEQVKAEMAKRHYRQHDHHGSGEH